jgi:hypothetical protein
MSQILLLLCNYYYFFPVAVMEVELPPDVTDSDSEWPPLQGVASGSWVLTRCNCKLRCHKKEKFDCNAIRADHLALSQPEHANKVFATVRHHVVQHENADTVQWTVQGEPVCQAFFEWCHAVSHATMDLYCKFAREGALELPGEHCMPHLLFTADRADAWFLNLYRTAALLDQCSSHGYHVLTDTSHPLWATAVTTASKSTRFIPIHYLNPGIESFADLFLQYEASSTDPGSRVAKSTLYKVWITNWSGVLRFGSQAITEEEHERQDHESASSHSIPAPGARPSASTGPQHDHQNAHTQVPPPVRVPSAQPAPGWPPPPPPKPKPSVPQPTIPERWWPRPGDYPRAPWPQFENPKAIAIASEAAKSLQKAFFHPPETKWENSPHFDPAYRAKLAKLSECGTQQQDQDTTTSTQISTVAILDKPEPAGARQATASSVSCQETNLSGNEHGCDSFNQATSTPTGLDSVGSSEQATAPPTPNRQDVVAFKHQHHEEIQRGRNIRLRATGPDGQATQRVPPSGGHPPPGSKESEGAYCPTCQLQYPRYCEDCGAGYCGICAEPGYFYKCTACAARAQADALCLMALHSCDHCDRPLRRTCDQCNCQYCGYCTGHFRKCTACV